MRAVLKNIKQELKHSGILAVVYQHLSMASADEEDVYDYGCQFVGEMSGKVLSTKLVIEARNEEMATYYAQDAYEKKPIEEC